MSFGSILIRWYKINKRDLPWRHTTDPYLIWLSEIIMQQTRIEQGLAYYNRFAEKYPKIKSLAEAKEDDILKLWQGLGYYSRARNLHKASKQIMNDFEGKFPDKYEDILSLRGVGEYTAAAISSFAYDKKYPVVDGNVFRFLSRHFGIDTAIDTLSGKKEFTRLADELMENLPPAIFNQAIMEFGARQCRPSNPLCDECPFNTSCYSFKENTVQLFPVKKNITKVRDRFFNYLVIKMGNSFFIRKRNGKDIWNGLHDFPLIETNKRLDENSFLQLLELKNIFSGKHIRISKISKEYKHILSHQHIHARFYEISSDNNILNKPQAEWKKVTKNSVRKYAVPRLVEKYINNE